MVREVSDKMLQDGQSMWPLVCNQRRSPQQAASSQAEERGRNVSSVAIGSIMELGRKKRIVMKGFNVFGAVAEVFLVRRSQANALFK